MFAIGTACRAKSFDDIDVWKAAFRMENLTFVSASLADIGNLNQFELVRTVRHLLHAEARFVRISPSSITISSDIFTADGGLDARVDDAIVVRLDSILKQGLTGYQLKIGKSFCPWRSAHLRSELLSNSGELKPAVRKLLEAGGNYFLICSGHDFTPTQRDDAKIGIAQIFLDTGFADWFDRIVVVGQTQLLEFVERYPAIRALITGRGDDDFLTLDQLAKHDHMRSSLQRNARQDAFLDEIRERIRSGELHVRVTGAAGAGKTRLVLEALSDVFLMPTALYVEHGSKFADTSLFRRLVREGCSYPTVLILDELPESALSGIWGHLKARCGALQIISIDHAEQIAADGSISTLRAPSLDDEAIRAILSHYVEPSHHLDRWVKICEGSPRVAHAVGDNLKANPADVLRPPATVDVWGRFLIGYGQTDSLDSRQTLLVMRHIALFERFGYEHPVVEEGQFVARLVQQADASITPIRFQEIVAEMRKRRVLQGGHTLFVVPFALHVFLWRDYWDKYATSFDFEIFLTTLPQSLEHWFTTMFQFGHRSAATSIVKRLASAGGPLRREGAVAKRGWGEMIRTFSLTDPASVLALLEEVFAPMSQADLLEFKPHRSNVVDALEAIAVWNDLFVRAVTLLARLATAEISTYANNSTSVFKSLFYIGPEHAATEASPERRMPLLRNLLLSAATDERDLAVKCLEEVLNIGRPLWQSAGAARQGVREDAYLWRPKDKEEWLAAYRKYWRLLFDVTRAWPDPDRSRANAVLLTVSEGLLSQHVLVEEVFDGMQAISVDPATDYLKLCKLLANQANPHWQSDENIRLRMKQLDGNLARRTNETRLQRYVLAMDFDEWHGLGAQDAPRVDRAHKRVSALGRRLAVDDAAFAECLQLLINGQSEYGLVELGESICEYDLGCKRFDALVQGSLSKPSLQCMGGYLQRLRVRNSALWQRTISNAFDNAATAAWAATFLPLDDCDEELREKWCSALELGYLVPSKVSQLHFGKAWKFLTQERLERLLRSVLDSGDEKRVALVTDLVDSASKGGVLAVSSSMIWELVTSDYYRSQDVGTMPAYHWDSLCKKLVDQDESYVLPMLECIVGQHSFVSRVFSGPYTDGLVTYLSKKQPSISWNILAAALSDPIRGWYIENWVRGSARTLAGQENRIGRLPLFPMHTIFTWVDEHPSKRAVALARLLPGTLVGNPEGELTRRCRHKMF